VLAPLLQLGQNPVGQGQQAEITGGITLHTPVEHSVTGGAMEGLDPVAGEGREALPKGPGQKPLALHRPGFEITIGGLSQVTLHRHTAQELIGMTGTAQIPARPPPPPLGRLTISRISSGAQHHGQTHEWRGGTGETEVHMPSARAQELRAEGQRLNCVTRPQGPEKLSARRQTHEQRETSNRTKPWQFGYANNSIIERADTN